MSQVCPVTHYLLLFTWQTTETRFLLNRQTGIHLHSTLSNVLVKMHALCATVNSTFGKLTMI